LVLLLAGWMQVSTLLTRIARCHGRPTTAISGTLVNLASLKVGVEAAQVDGECAMNKVSMSRRERILLEGWVRLSGNVL